MSDGTARVAPEFPRPKDGVISPEWLSEVVAYWRERHLDLMNGVDGEQ